MSQIDGVLHTKLKSLLARPRPFILYTDSAIYRARRVVSLGEAGDPTASAVVQTQLGEKSIALSDVEDVVIREEGFQA
jgi:hypothetical protein